MSLFIMAQVEFLFPIPVYIEKDLIDEKENKLLQDRVLQLSSSISKGGNEWNCNTFTSKDTYDLRDDKTFSNVINKVTYHVNTFAKTYASEWEYKLETGWFNIARKNSYQEYHNHPDASFSAVYYVSLPPGSGEIVFRSGEDNMLSLRGMVEYNRINSTYWGFQPMERSLMIFKSSLQHMVKMGINKKPRISLALNY